MLTLDRFNSKPSSPRVSAEISSSLSDARSGLQQGQEFACQNDRVRTDQPSSSPSVSHQLSSVYARTKTRGKKNQPKWLGVSYTKTPGSLSRVLENKPDDDLLSHGETPHYHRRRAVSLLSSVWDQVVPTRYCRQTNVSRFCGSRKSFLRKLANNHRFTARIFLPAQPRDHRSREVKQSRFRRYVARCVLGFWLLVVTQTKLFLNSSALQIRLYGQAARAISTG